MMHGLHKFQHVWAWFIVKNNSLIEQGYSEDETQARKDYQAALMLWSTHDYSKD